VNNSKQTIEELIAKHLSGETTPEELHLLNDWLNKDSSNRKYYDSLETIFNDTAGLKSNKIVDTDAAWDKLKSKIDQNKNTPAKVFSITRNTFLRIAAAIIIIAGAGIALYIISELNNGEQYRIATNEKAKQFNLADGSTIFLNKNSVASVSFYKKERKVILQGEGFFTVVHNNEQPFIVSASGLEIKDIGTAFNVDASDSNYVDVVVEHGEVQLSAGKERMNIIKGERSVYSKSNHTISKLSVVDPNEFSYSTKIFVFENTSLPAVILKLNEVYGTNIVISENLNFCRLTSTFRNEKIEYIVQIIAETLQLTVVKKNNTILLDGNNCPE
jgi:transmembrane sensor